MNIPYETAQLILRALKGHAKRMQDIAGKERMIGQFTKAEVAAKESRLALEAAAVLEKQGVSITS